ncbi:MAG: transcriptional repressor LexA [Gammaproteobacteria bacterium]|nr:transcriptional repressor LexA [Gammaproteobacteria bacterium]
MISDSQRKTLSFIRQYVARYGYAPKLQEIATGIGISSRGVVHRYIQALVQAGYLENLGGKHRGLRLLDKGRESGQAVGGIPLLGKIAAGRPIEAICDQNGGQHGEQNELNLQTFFSTINTFAVRVEGDSMIEMGILDGDIVIVKSADSAKSGEVVVALIDGEEVTLKRLEYTKEGLVSLMPANKKMQAMIYEPGRVHIQGILIGSVRKY